MSRQKKNRMKKIGLLLTMALVFTMVVSPAAPAMADNPHTVEVFNEPVRRFGGYRVRINTSTAYSTTEAQGGTISNNKTTRYLETQGSWTFTANPKTGYVFDGWTINAGRSDAFSISGQSITIEYKGNQNYTATANFREVAKYTLSTGVPGGHGTISKNPDKTAYTEGDSVQLTANPDAGYRFVEWTGDASGDSNPLTVKMDSDKTINAVFEALPTYTLSVGVDPAGSGSVTKNPDVPSYYHGQSVTLTPNAASGWRFGSWSGDASGSAKPLALTMDRDKSVTANFIKTYTVTLHTQGHGHLNNRGAIEKAHDVNSTINLNDAKPEVDLLYALTWMFLGWRDDDTGQILSSPTVTVTRDRSFTAVFAEKDYLSLRAGDHGYLANDISGHYAQGTSINLNDAQPTGDPGYTLDCWKEYGWNFWGDGEVVPLVNGQPIITIGESNYFKAHFKVANYSISYDLQGGTVSGNPTSYKYFDPEITLKNPTKTGYTFAGWEGTDLSEPTMIVKIPTHSSGDRSYTATWTANTYTVKYHANGGDGGATADSIHTYDTAAPLSLNGFTRTGCAFIGWATSPDGPVVYSDGQSVINLTDVNGATVNLYAKWRISGVTVTGFDGEYDGIPHSVTVSGTLPGDTVTYSTDGVNYNSVKPFFTNATSDTGVTVYVRVQRAGAADFNDAKVVKIAKALLTVTADNKTTTYGSAAPSFTASYSGFKGSDTKSVLSGAPSFACPYKRGDGSGSYTITVTQGTLGAVNYDFTFNTGTLLVKKTTLTITADNKTVPFGAPAPVYTATYSGFKGDDDESVLSGTLVFDCAYTAGSPVSGSPYTITPSGLSSGDYYIIYVPGALTVYSTGGGSRSSSASTPSPSPSPEVTPEPTPAPTQEPGESEPTPEPTLAPEELEDEEVPAGSADVKGGSSVWTSWWFWLVILAGVLLILFLLLLMFKREKDKKEKEAKAR